VLVGGNAIYTGSAKSERCNMERRKINFEAGTFSYLSQKTKAREINWRRENVR
jgi:hypothetical protein